MAKRGRKKGGLSSHKGLRRIGGSYTPNKEYRAVEHARLRSLARGEQLPQTLGTPDFYKGELVPPAKVWQSDRAQGVQEYNYKYLRNSSKYVLKLYLGDEYFFVEENHIRGIKQKSTTYKSIERAMEIYRLGKIIWVEAQEIASSDDKPDG